ncbi:unnamed protein product [Cochlearia groenlandica]
MPLDRCCFFEGYFGLLGNEAQGILDRIRDNCAILAIGDIRDSFICSSAKNSESVGRTVSPVAIVLIDRDKFLSHGLFGISSFCKVWSLHFDH